MKRNIMTVAIVLFGIVACSAPEADAIEEEIAATVEVAEEEVKAQTPHDLILNNGKKWLVDKGMTVSVDKINKTIRKYNSNDLVDYQILGDNIGQYTKALIASCTMSGQAHDQVHKWLAPFIELTEALVMTSSPEAGAELLSQIKKEMAIYNDYFE